MGDTIELDNYPVNVSKHLAVSASGLSFQVKTRSDAILRLLASPADREPLAKIILGNRSSAIDVSEQQGDSEQTTADTPGILSESEWRGFWVTWSRGCVRVGRANETEPFIKKEVTDLHRIKFVNPTSQNVYDSPLQWKFILGPVPPKIRQRVISGGEPAWVAAEEGLPLGALIGGHEKEPLHVIRAEHRGCLTPGKFMQSKGIGYISFDGNAHRKVRFEVLVGYNVDWVATSDDNIPMGAVPGGHDESDNREMLYVGRANVNGHLIVGRVQPLHKVLYIPYQGKEVARSEYEILVASSVADPRVQTLYNPSLRNHGVDGDDADEDEDDADEDEDENEDYEYRQNYAEPE